MNYNNPAQNLSYEQPPCSNTKAINTQNIINASLMQSFFWNV